MARLPRFPLAPNVCAVIANVAGAGFYASLSKYARPKSLRLFNKPSWNRANGNIRPPSRLRSTDISISTQSEDADSDAQRRKGDVSRGMPTPPSNDQSIDAAVNGTRPRLTQNQIYVVPQNQRRR